MNHLSRSKIFLYSLVLFIVGIFLGPYFGRFLVNLPLIVVLLNFYILVLLLFLFRKNKLIYCFLVFLFLCFLGIWRYQSFLPKIDEGHVGFYVDTGEEYLISGMVSDEPEVDSNMKIKISNILIISNFQFPISNQYSMTNFQLKGKILVSIPKYYEVKYGDKVQFTAKLASPKEYDSSASLGTSGFDYKGYLARYGVYAVVKGIDEFEVIANYANLGEFSRIEKGKYFVWSTLFKVKNYFSSVIAKIYPEPHSAFMLGLLVGEKKSLPDWLLLVFQIVGITHIIAISGYNITILAKVAEKTLGKVGRKYIFWGVLAMIVCFVILTGAQSSIVRAGIMGVLMVYAGFIGRKSNIVNALVLAGVVMIFLNPLILRNDVGFQLSFLATLGLVYISPVFESWFAKMPNTICQLLSATLAAQVLTLPIIISSFGLVSLISPLANIIVLPFIPVAMFLGFLSGVLGIVWIPLGQLVGFLGYIILDIIIKIASLLSMIPYASVELKMDNWVFWSGYYVLVGVLVWVWYRKRK